VSVQPAQERRAGLATGSSRKLALDGAAASRTALRLAPELAYESWERVGAQLFLITDSSDWWLADWLVYGQSRYGNRYREAIELTGLDYQTLRNYAWVARKFEVSRRRDNLSFQHHAEVCALTNDEQTYWLDRAEESGWSKNELRRRMRMALAPPREISEPPEVVQLSLSLDRRREDRWREAARARKRALTTWMVEVLDEAAGDGLV
jgi:hypothetical protein